MKYPPSLLNDEGFPYPFINRQIAIDRARDRIVVALENVDAEEEELKKEISNWKQENNYE